MTPTANILITGGHLTPAIATIEQLQNIPNLNISFVGRKYTDTYKSQSIEKPQIESLGVRFIPYQAPKFHRKPLTKNIPQIISAPSALRNAFQILSLEKPNVILTFGGYLALPIALAAKLKKIPIVTHEQTTVFGLTNQLISTFAKKVALSWPQTSQIPSTVSSKVVLTGNPLRKEFFQSPPKPKWLNHSTKPLIYITGGNQGSQAINLNIASHINHLTKHYQVVHQTGHTRNFQDDKLMAKAIKKVPKLQQKNYNHQPWFSASEAAYLISHADLVISRSGANTTTELLLNQTKAVLIPLPQSARDEQSQNAKVLRSAGLAIILPQNQLNLLCQTIEISLKNNSKPSKKTQKLVKLHSQAAQNLANLVLSCATN